VSAPLDRNTAALCQAKWRDAHASDRPLRLDESSGLVLEEVFAHFSVVVTDVPLASHLPIFVVAGHPHGEGNYAAR